LAGVAIFLRTFLNWLVLLPALCAVLILMKLMALEVFSQWVAPRAVAQCGGGIANSWCCWLLPTVPQGRVGRRAATQATKPLSDEVVLPSLIAAVSFAVLGLERRPITVPGAGPGPQQGELGGPSGR
jgi:hypothetical protein